MNHNLRTPCSNCPFRTDVKPYLRGDRAEEIVTSIVDMQQDFACHKTLVYDGEHLVVASDSEHCAGAMIMLEKMERPNRMMRISERLGMYDRSRLRIDAPVYDDGDEMIAAYFEAEGS